MASSSDIQPVLSAPSADALPVAFVPDSPLDNALNMLITGGPVVWLLVIDTRFGTQEVNLEAGSVVLYPSTSLHCVNPVQSGARICSVFWEQSLIRDNQQRKILYELDQSVQFITLDNGQGDADVGRLTGIYA